MERRTRKGYRVLSYYSLCARLVTGVSMASIARDLHVNRSTITRMVRELRDEYGYRGEDVKRVALRFLIVARLDLS